MEKIKSIALDDEKHALKALAFELERHCPEVELLYQLQDPEKAKDIILKEPIDLVFLDINLKTTSGIDFLESLIPFDFNVIFVTAFDEFAIKAFDLSASHYLLKPVSGQKLKIAVEKVLSLRKQKMVRAELFEMLQSFKKEMEKINKVAIPVQEGIEFLDPNNILYLKADSNYTILYLSNGKSLTISKTLKEIEENYLTGRFLRIHKSNLVNISHLSKYVKAFGGYVIMSNGDKLMVSRNKRNLLNELFKA